MKIVIAPDKFKGSLTSFEFCELVADAITKHLPEAEVVKLPMADGGDGTVDVMNHYLKGELISCEVNDPLFRKITANYLFSSSKAIAYVEMASASGLHLLSAEEKNPLHTSTYGTGELILHAIQQGAKHIILGVGGSATNDAGMGMAKALGYQFFDLKGEELQGVGADLLNVHSISSVNFDTSILNIKFTLACDVENPLYGRNGAAHVYAPQKGADADTVKQLDLGLLNFSSLFQEKINFSFAKGAGAAGGMGFGAMIFLNAELQSGVDLLKLAAQLKKQIHNADWIITGEGQLDAQTLSGKVVKGIINEVDTQKVAVFCAINRLSDEEIKRLNISYCKEIISYSSSKEDSILHVKKYLLILTEDYLSNVKLKLI